MLEEEFPQHGNSKLFMIKSYKANFFNNIKAISYKFFESLHHRVP